jgi:hypothetical protein
MPGTPLAMPRGPEERLRAYLDGLVLGGPKVAEKLLIPGGDDPGAAFAAAFALAKSPSGEHARPWKSGH